MAEEQKYLYHCDRCGELFKSKQLAQEDIRCAKCGEHPARSKFAAVAEMPVLDKHDKKSKHSRTGMDDADIFSMKKKQKRKQWVLICLIWVAGLVVIALMANRMNNKAKAASKSSVELDEADKAYVARKDEALQKCAKRFISFATETVSHSKSSHILNGSELVLDINRYYSGNLMKNDLAASRIIRFDLIESGEQPKVVLLYKYQPKAGQTAEAYVFEVLFWKKGEDWFIDWPHFVRLGDMSWFRFGENKKINSPKRFKLYARELSAESLALGGYEEYKFSEAYNNSIMPNQLSKSVFVKKQTSLKTKLNSKFKEQEELRKKKVKSNNLIGVFDPPKTIRLGVTVDFNEIEGETVMVLKEIHELDWETPPSKKN
ncbi:MAG: transcription initiation factor TFIIIB Brf1 subunit/transcription initiation factor TFIIB [Cryomorphaceae bacterium]|jgi:transcription initiation factor TFIIIB Brf1 subunit/transcription initiation factor TFIIB